MTYVSVHVCMESTNYNVPVCSYGHIYCSVVIKYCVSAGVLNIYSQRLAEILWHLVLSLSHAAAFASCCDSCASCPSFGDKFEPWGCYIHTYNCLWMYIQCMCVCAKLFLCQNQGIVILLEVCVFVVGFFFHWLSPKALFDSVEGGRHHLLCCTQLVRSSRRPPPPPHHQKKKKEKKEKKAEHLNQMKLRSTFRCNQLYSWLNLYVNHTVFSFKCLEMMFVFLFF